MSKVTPGVMEAERTLAEVAALAKQERLQKMELTAMAAKDSLQASLA